MSSSEISVKKVEKAIQAVRAGEMVILVDDEDRENEGDLCLAAEMVTPQHINFMAKHGRGLICLSLTPERCDALDLPMMTSRNRSPLGTAFTVSIEARRGVTTGISASDRATTIRTAVADDARPEDLVSPGHIFPLRSVPGGVLERTGQTEGSVDLARLAGMKPAGVICEIMREDGTMARMPDLEAFAEEHGLQILSIADLISYRLQRETLVERMAGGSYVPGLEGVGGDFRAYVYRSRVGGAEFFALALGEWSEEDAVPVRVHSACIGDVFNSQKCDCGALLRESLRRVDEEGRGVVLYIMPHRIRLAEQFQGHVLHEPRSRAQEEADWEEPLRGFGLGAQVLLDIGVRKIKLLTNNPKRIAGLAGYGLTVVERVPVPIPETHHNVTYLELKRERGEHESPGSDPNGEQSNGDSEDEVSNG